MYNKLDDGLYCMYLRKSREDVEAELHGEGDTLLRHERTLMNLAKKLNISIGCIYREIVSGESIDARPEVQKLIADVEQRKWKGVLVVEVERLARGDTLDQGIIARAFAISSTKIITPLKIYDPANDSDMEYFEFGLFMSRREYATINRRIQNGRRASVLEGKWIYGCAPYGYKIVKLNNDKGYTLAFEESEYDAVALIWKSHVYDKVGSTTIALRLKERGFKSREGNDFSPSSIRDILKNIAYAGFVKFGERKEIKEIVNGKVKKRRATNPNPTIAKGLHPAYVTLEEFNIGKQIRSSRAICSVNFRTDGLQNPLAGICVCRKCGHVMQRQVDGNSKKKENIVYRLTCNTPGCPNVSSDISLVEDAITNVLDVWTQNHSLELSMDTNGSFDTFDEDLRRLEKEKALLESQREKLYDLLERSVYNEDTFISRNLKITNKISEVQQLIDNLVSKHEERQRQVNIEEFLKRVKTVREAYAHAESAEEKNKLLKFVFNKIEYEKSVGGRGHESEFELEFHPIVDFLR